MRFQCPLLGRKQTIHRYTPRSAFDPTETFNPSRFRADFGLHTLALSPIRDALSEGFSHFVTSIAAPVASGWSVCRVGLAPTGKRRLVTAHTQTGPQRKAALGFIFTKSLFARLQT